MQAYASAKTTMDKLKAGDQVYVAKTGKWETITLIEVLHSTPQKIRVRCGKNVAATRKFDAEINYFSKARLAARKRETARRRRQIPANI